MEYTFNRVFGTVTFYKKLLGNGTTEDCEMTFYVVDDYIIPNSKGNPIVEVARKEKEGEPSPDAPEFEFCIGDNRDLINFEKEFNDVYLFVDNRQKNPINKAFRSRVKAISGRVPGDEMKQAAAKFGRRRQPKPRIL